MRPLLQCGRLHQRPTWLLLLTFLCVLMVTVMSTVQVAHSHESFSMLKQNPGHNGPSTSDHCPFCGVMRADLPVSMDAPKPVLQVHVLDTVAAEAERTFRWRFEMASRPPPADTHRA